MLYLARRKEDFGVNSYLGKSLVDVSVEGNMYPEDSKQVSAVGALVSWEVRKGGRRSLTHPVWEGQRERERWW